MSGIRNSMAWQINVLGGLWASQWADNNLAADSLSRTNGFRPNDKGQPSKPRNAPSEEKEC